MGTQKKIEKKIISNDANYILAVKANQLQLLENIKDEFKFSNQLETDKNEDLGHGRIETRICSAIIDFYFIENKNEWKNLKSILKIESTREFKIAINLHKKQSVIICLVYRMMPMSFNRKYVHNWAVENKLHWPLDVAFSEDASRKRVGKATKNYSILLKIALNL